MDKSTIASSSILKCLASLKVLRGHSVRSAVQRGVMQYVDDYRGNVGITFGLCALPAIILTGAAIDYSRSVTQWSNLQQATDATALTVAHAYLTQSATGSSLSTFAQTYLNGLMNGAKLDGDPVISGSNTVVCVNTKYNTPTMMMKIININSMNVASHACSQVGNTYEVALALDNSYSMSETDANGTSKISALQSAAKTLVGILIPNGQSAPQVGISIVPFNSLVNVGSSNSNAAFMDTSGSSSIHWQNFLLPNGGTFNPTSKFDLFKGMNTSWGGCVEELPPPYTTADTAPSSNADAKFVPYLAPDDPGALDNSSNPPYTTYSATGTTSFTTTSPQYFFNSYLGDNGSSTNNLGACSANGKNAVYGNADKQNSNALPTAGMTMVCKYAGTPNSSNPTTKSAGSGFTVGPNLECGSQPLLPLTTDSSALNSKIDALSPGGSTNLGSGFMWAWRSISPTVNAFPVSNPSAIGPQPAKAYNYGPPANQKVIILMTDGTNSWGSLQQQNGTYYNSFGSLYEGFGFLSNNRISSYLSKNLVSAETCSGTYLNAGNARCALDQVTMEACNNAKAKGVVVYTIGFSVPKNPIDSIGQSILTQCASSTSKYFLATDAASIQAAFQAIAASILSLRLTK